MDILYKSLAIGAAGSAGALLRFLVANVCVYCFGASFPIGTLIINVTGSFLLGWFLTLTDARLVVPDTFRLAVAVGFVGAYTTFSTFAFETNSLIENSLGSKAVLNCLLSVGLGLVAVRLGIWFAGR